MAFTLAIISGIYTRFVKQKTNGPNAIQPIIIPRPILNWNNFMQYSMFLFSHLTNQGFYIF